MKERRHLFYSVLICVSALSAVLQCFHLCEGAPSPVLQCFDLCEGAPSTILQCFHLYKGALSWIIFLSVLLCTDRGQELTSYATGFCCCFNRV